MSHTAVYNDHRYKCSKWLKDKIKALEKIDNRTLEENFELYSSYKTLVHVPFWTGPLDEDEIEINRLFTKFGIELFRTNNYLNSRPL